MHGLLGIAAGAVCSRTATPADVAAASHRLWSVHALLAHRRRRRLVVRRPEGRAREGIAAALGRRPGRHRGRDVAEERVAARMCLAALPLATFVDEALIPYEDDDVTRLIVDRHDATAFAAIAHLTVGDFRDWLLLDTTDTATLARVAPGITPEMAAAVSKLMRNQDLIAVAKKCSVVTRFRDTIGLPGRLAIRLQPNHPTDDPKGIAISMLDGLMYGAGDAVIGINPATDDVQALIRLWHALDEVRDALRHPDADLRADARDEPDRRDRARRADRPRVPVGRRDAEGERELRHHARDARRGARRGAVAEVARPSATRRPRTSCTSRPGRAVRCRPTRITASTSRPARRGPTPSRARIAPLLVNSVVGFIGPEYLYDGKQIIRAGSRGPLLRQAARRAARLRRLLHEPRRGRLRRHGHADDAARDRRRHVPDGRARRRRRDARLPEHVVPRRAVPAVAARARRAPEFEAWLAKMGLADATGRLVDASPAHPLLADFSARWTR